MQDLMKKNDNVLDLRGRWKESLQVAEQIRNSGLVPESLKSAAQVVIVMETGKEIGVPPMEALRGIYVVGNRTALSAQLMLSLLYKSGVIADIKFEETKEFCKVTMTRKGMTPFTTQFGKAEAEQAGLQYRKGEMYKKYPGNMYRARAISNCARIVAPDVIGGLYLKEELEAEVDTEQDVQRVNKSEALITEDGYKEFSQHFFSHLDDYLAKAEKPYDIRMLERGMKEDLSRLKDEDIIRAKTMLSEKFSSLVMGKDVEFHTYDEYLQLAQKCKDVKGLQDWLKSVQKQAQDWLNEEEFEALIDVCNDLKASFTPRSVEQIKEETELYAVVEKELHEAKTPEELKAVLNNRAKDTIKLKKELRGKLADIFEHKKADFLAAQEG